MTKRLTDPGRSARYGGSAGGPVRRSPALSDVSRGLLAVPGDFQRTRSQPAKIRCKRTGESGEVPGATDASGVPWGLLPGLGPGSAVAAYQVEDQLGAGGMAV